QLVKDKKIKKNRKQPAITQEEIYFSVPESWAYARLEDIYDVRDGTHDSPKPTSEGFPLVTSKNLSSGKLDLSDVKLISKEDHIKVIERSRVDRNDILFAMIGSIGNPVIVDTEIEFSIKNVGLFKYYNPQDSSPNYLNYFLKYAAEIMKKQSAGGVQPFVSLGKLRSFVMPTPPLAEQHRIVAKVDELMALCDQLEQQTEASIEAHQLLVSTLLNT
ncbi:restriction endonuclease subunit S, partial [Photobacterium damselae]